MALTLKINMLEIVKSISDDKKFLNAFIPFIRQDAIKEEFGQRYIDKILERLDEGLGVTGPKGNRTSKKLKKYSPRYAGGYDPKTKKNYKPSDAFRAYGKDPGTVNLKLTGSMRADIDVVDVTPVSVVLGFIDNESEQKALGHINGTEILPVRDFWGLPKTEEQQLMKEVIREFKANELDTIDFRDSDNPEIEIGVEDFLEDF